MEDLNEKGFKPKTWKTKTGKIVGCEMFNHAMISNILNNPIYIGMVPYKGELYKGQHKAIITQELWDETRKVKKDNIGTAFSLNKEFYVSRIAYKIQELAYGGLSASQQKLIANMYIPPENRNNLPPTGTRIVREYLGVEHIVTVLRDGFEYNGMKYTSLSAVAKKITGRKISGRYFFALDK